MHKTIFTLAALASLTMPALSEPSAQAVVRSFYQDYDATGRDAARDGLRTLLSKQKKNLDGELYSLLYRVDHLDSPHSEWGPPQLLGIAPHGVKSYRLGNPSIQQGVASVPVITQRQQDSEPAAVRVRVVLRKQGGQWKISNFAYPAYDKGQAWDLKSSLREQIQQSAGANSKP